MNLSVERSYWWYKEPLSRLQRLGLGVATGLLAALAWHPVGATLLIFVAFVPLLLAGEDIAAQGRGRRGWRFWGVAYLALFLFNLITTWWIKNATVEGAAAAIILNAALMTIPLAVYYRTRLRWGVVAGLCTLVPAWLLFEKIHLGWELSWPWLTLGNVFCNRVSWVQWYSVTGHLGGSAWVWWVNAILFLGFCHADRKHLAKAVCWATAVVLLLLTVSLSMAPFAIDHLPRTEVVAVQPNIDPYLQKFEGSPGFIPYEQQVARMERLSDSLITPKTRWVLWPETALDASLSEDAPHAEPLLRRLQAWVDAHPGLNLVVGATTYHVYPADSAPAGARRSAQGDRYDVYNTALHLQAGNPQIGIYHKSKLVPGVEGIPYPGALSLLNSLAINLGGTSGGLGRQPEREVFATANGAQRLAPAICYESVFGDFMADFARQGGQAIAIITNDAGWGNTAGHQQHLLLARLRAVEERRWVARSANTGISGFIDPAGNLSDTLGYGRMGAVRRSIGLSDQTTGYMLWGDAGLILLIVAFCIWLGRTSLPIGEAWLRRS